MLEVLPSFRTTSAYTLVTIHSSIELYNVSMLLRSWLSAESRQGPLNTLYRLDPRIAALSNSLRMSTSRLLNRSLGLNMPFRVATTPL